MKLQKSRNLAAFAALLTVMGAAAPRALAQAWQASTDYSTVQGYRNWRYMTYIPGSPGTYELMVYGRNFYGFDSWHSESNYGEFIREGGIMHPAFVTGETARVWESPVAGSVRVAGMVAKGDPGSGDGVYATIWKNGSLLWDATIAFDDLVGYSYDLTVAVQPGDWLIFRVDRRSNANSDSTVFDPNIAVEFLDPTGSGSWIEGVLRDMSTYAEGLPLSMFEGPTPQAKTARRMVLSHGLTVAANLVAVGNINAVLNELLLVRCRVDGSPGIHDWIVDEPERSALYADINQLLNLLGRP